MAFCLEREEAHCKFAADGNWKKESTLTQFWREL